MKTRVVIGSLLATMMTLQVVAQRAENDDMYFNSKDRDKLRAERGDKVDASVNDKIDADYNSFRKKHFDKNETETVAATEAANPTDSYSARSVNPEYISRSTSEQASEDEQNYYVEGYVPANTYDSYSATSNYNNSSYNNGYYGNGYSPYASMYSPYGSIYSPYGSMYSPYGSMFSPYYGTGLTFSMGYMWGSPGWNYGMNYGYGGGYYNPYSYYPSYYSPYYSSYYGSGYGYGYPVSYYGSNDSSRPNSGKRPSRHSAIVAPMPRSSERVVSNTTNGISNGRSRQAVDEYYVKPFRRPITTDSYGSSTTGTSRDRYVRPSTDYGSRTRDSFSGSQSRDRSSFSTPTRSSSSFSMPSRSSSGGGGGGGSSPAPRSRH